MRTIERLTGPVARIGRAASRPTTYTGHIREATSLIVTAGMWPFGFAGAQLPLIDRPDADALVQTPVLLLHGYGANKSNWLFVTHHLHQAGFRNVHTFNYNPLAADIPELAARCVCAAEMLKAHLGVERIHLVGHSFGGIIARYAVQVLGLGGVGVCASVASPHGGVESARMSSLLAGMGPLRSLHDLRPGSPVMARLGSCPRPAGTRFVAYYSNLDLIVPAARAKITEPELAAENILVKDHGHLSIMLSRRLTASVVERLSAAEGRNGHGVRSQQVVTPTREIDVAPSASRALPGFPA